MLGYFTQNNVVVSLQLNSVALSFISRNRTFLLFCCSAFSFREQRCFGHDRVEWVQLMVIWVGCTLRVESFDEGPLRTRNMIEWQSSLCEVVDHCLENFLCVYQRCTILSKEQLRDQLIDGLGCLEEETEIVVALSSALVRIYVWEEQLTWGCSWTLLSFYGRRCSRGASQAGGPSISCLACNFSSNSIFLTSSQLVSASSPVPHFSLMS